MYQRAFAIDDRVAVHIDGAFDCVLMSTRDAGTRRRFYRRQRPSGQDIDDIEASLAHVESKAKAPMEEVIAGAPLDHDRKGALAQFIAVQMLRGPAFFARRHENFEELLDELGEDAFRPDAVVAAGGDPDLVRQQVTDAHSHPTQRFMAMLQTAPKIATILAHMRWQVLVCRHPWLAYSDHPVVVWPLNAMCVEPFQRQHLGPIGAIEIRVPLAPTMAILMTWQAKVDVSSVVMGRRAASEINAFTIGQADRQWMHRPGSEPPRTLGSCVPLSQTLDPSYNDAAMLQSPRRQRALAHQQRVAGKRFVREIEVL
jgi:hypothetical protein